MVWGVGALFPLWGGCGVLGFRVWLKLVSFGFTVKRYKASSRKGLREDLQCTFCFGLRACI